jgi:two-component system nitrogen regulation sensor histidine kinase NtrY
MPLRPDRELNRLYTGIALGLLIISLFQAYKLISAQVGAGIDAPSRWFLLALGLTNLLAIVALLWIVARSLAKLYFERRQGILGSRIRTRLVVAIFAVALVPSLLLFLVGRNFIAKNVDRWFLPETQEVIQDGKALAEAFDAQVNLRLETARQHLLEQAHGDLAQIRSELGLDLLARGGARSLAADLPDPGEA